MTIRAARGKAREEDLLAFEVAFGGSAHSQEFLLLDDDLDDAV
jgi:hypothetical protein